MTLIAQIQFNSLASGVQTIGGNQTLSNGNVYADVYIVLLDPASGYPTNGNGVLVKYTQIVQGVISEHEVYIQGQSIIIYSGLLIDDLYEYPKFIITYVGNVQPDLPAPDNICDLVINYINIDKPESAPGASDGQVTVNAKSTYGPVKYSLDNITFQSSGIFPGLPGGLKTIYVTDSNGCAATGSITLPVSNNLLSADPSKTIAVGNTCRWNAAFNPIVFTYQRKDFEVTSVSLDTLTGKASLAVNCDTKPIASAITANNKAIANAATLNIVLTNVNALYIYLKTNAYTGTFQVLSVTSSGGLVIDTPYIVNATGYININLLRPYYQVRTQITYFDQATGNQKNIISTNRPDNNGLIKADISNFLQSLVNTKDESTYTQINSRDDNLSASYQIAYAEYWDGKLAANNPLTYTPLAQPYYVLYAAKQLGNKYGGNLAAYVPFKTVADNNDLAKWITDFAEPAYSINYPFDIGFIYSDDLDGLQLYCEIVPLDINRNPIAGGPKTSYLLNDDASWLLNQDSSKLIVAGQGTSNISLPAQLGLNRLLFNESFGSDVYYFTLSVNYLDNDDNVQTVTQTQTVRVDDAVDEQSVYLRWIGLTGSWNYYRFVYNQEISLDVQNAVIIKNYVFDWENQDGIEEVVSKNAGQKMKVMAEDLSVSDIKGLQTIKYSPKVQMLINKNPVKWQTVVLNTATFSEYETVNGHAPFSVTFNLPAINIQSQ